VKYIIVLALLLVAGCSEAIMEKNEEVEKPENVQLATFAGGCFWCMVHPFDSLDGVLDVTAGYAGGQVENPSYKEVSAGGTGHAEAVQITYDPFKVTYAELVEVFWKQINPTDEGGQFNDRGGQYRTEIFYHDEEQRKVATDSLRKLNESGRFDKPLVTPITKFTNFYPAEEYHQDYYKKNPVRYKVYRAASGRDRYLKSVWEN
jgi:methionine-S-sulfoxide reductase